MVVFFKKGSSKIYAVQCAAPLTELDKQKLVWLFDGATPLAGTQVKGTFVGPRREMITPWSTNAVEITQNMGMDGISRIEEFNLSKDENPVCDKMLQRIYHDLDGKVFDIDRKPEEIVYINDISEYNKEQGLALSPDEENYLRQLAEKLGRPLTDSEVFGFSQVNSEHCRHKIFNGTFIIDGEEKPMSLFKLIKKTSQENPNGLVSAYKDNVAFVKGPKVTQFAPSEPDAPSMF
ncbi:MAG: phosphoribosylformylglycinamidine synthase, partial [Muribaculaceae bacterium]|nr:phosphoribosylformylglycinamidine synthase [Muribaculaceae bacterium]